ncbi:MAG: ADOP family duplicated permease, partial [Gemmatimonadota bacterium]
MPRGLLPNGVRRLFTLPLSRDRLLRDADDEVAFHIEMWKKEYRARGMNEPDADAEARRRFGDADEYRAYAASRSARNARRRQLSQWFVEWMEDVRFATRQLRKSPAFTAVAVLTMALGIGANTAVFSVVHRLLVAPLPYPNGGRVVALRVTSAGKFAGRFTSGSVSIAPDAPANPPRALVKAWRNNARSLEMVAGYENLYLSLLPSGQQDTVSHALVTANFLALLGVRPELGRDFRPDDERAVSARVAMISHEWWQRAFGGGNDAIGRVVEYEGNPYVVVGVMPRGLTLPMTSRALDQLTVPSPDVWLPASIDSVNTPFALLRSGQTADAATRELQLIANGVYLEGQGDTLRVRAMRAQDFLAPREVQTVEILFVAVGVLLLIACANVANLLLVRAWNRRGEFAVRMGLGAGRARLVRLALTESLLLALVSGAVGVLIAWQGVRLIAALRPIALDNLGDVGIEPVVLAWTAGISVLTGILFGAAAAFFVGSRSVTDLLRSETQSTSATGTSRRVRSTLVVLEIALSLTLLVGAGLLARSFLALQQVRIGFDPHNLVSIDVLMPPTIGRAARGALSDAIVGHLREVPGVIDAAVGTLPTASFRNSSPLEVETSTGDQALGVPEFTSTSLSSDYFRTTGIRLLTGRSPVASPADLSSGFPLIGLSEEIVVNRALARRVALDGNVVGRRLRVAHQELPPGAFKGPQPSDAWSTIVGVAEDVQLPGSGGSVTEYQLYSIPSPRFPPTFVVRMVGVPADLESVLRNAIQEVEPTLIARRARNADDYVREALAPTRFAMALLVAFAVVALVLSVVGLYASISYTVSQRTREIGIRVALGATPRGIVSLVLADGVRLAGLGLVIGMGASFAGTRVLAGLLYDVKPVDPVTFVGI